VGADTGPADSVDTDSDPSTASTFGPTNILGGGDVAADGAVSLGSTTRCPVLRYVHASEYMDTP